MPHSIEHIQAQILFDYVEVIRQEIITAQNNASPPLRASGRLQTSLKVSVGVHSDRAFLSSEGNYLETTYDQVGIPAGQVFPFRQLLESWIPFKPRFRNADGTFMSAKSAAYVVARKIWLFGSAVHRKTRRGIPIFAILRSNLPKTARRLAQAYARDFAADVKRRLE